MMSFKSILKPEGSTMAGVATVGTVFAVYQLNVGTVAEAAATDANHPVLANSRKKAGYTALAIVAALTLITRDANVGILGGGSIIAMEFAYRHGIMSNPGTMKMENPNPNAAYSPAENVVPFAFQGEAA
jgi:hypothetical protein